MMLCRSALQWGARTILLLVSTLLTACEAPPTGGAAGGADTTNGSTSPIASADGDTAAAVVAPAPRVDQISLLSLPVVLNWDDDPAPDGLRVRIYLFHVDTETRAVLLTRGTIEFVVYEGLVGDADLTTKKPLHTWRYTAAEMRQFAGRTQFGETYALALDWGDHVPTTSSITFTVRILRPRPEPDLYAKPMKLSVKAQ